jgi:hypothetical protein
MDVFIIDAPNRPGELAKVSQALGDKNINIDAVAAVGGGDQGVVGIISNNDAATRATLDDAGVTYRTIPCMTVNLPNRPGELAGLTRRLTYSGINLEFVAPIGLADTATIALGVSDTQAARAALKDGIS